MKKVAIKYTDNGINNESIVGKAIIVNADVAEKMISKGSAVKLTRAEINKVFVGVDLEAEEQKKRTKKKVDKNDGQDEESDNDKDGDDGGDLNKQEEE